MIDTVLPKQLCRRPTPGQMRPLTLRLTVTEQVWRDSVRYGKMRKCGKLLQKNLFWMTPALQVPFQNTTTTVIISTAPPLWCRRSVVKSAA